MRKFTAVAVVKYNSDVLRDSTVRSRLVRSPGHLACRPPRVTFPSVAVGVEVERPLFRLLFGRDELAAPVIVGIGDASHHVLLDDFFCGRHPSYRDDGVTVLGVVARAPSSARRQSRSAATTEPGNRAVHQIDKQHNDGDFDNQREDSHDPRVVRAQKAELTA